MQIGSPSAGSDGSWSVGVHGAHVAELIHAFDPELPFVVIEGHTPTGTGWQRLEVPLNRDPGSSAPRWVRAVRFDLLMTPQEAVEAASALDTGFPDGGLYAWQSPDTPPPRLHLLDKQADARKAAMRGVGVTLLVDLPHAGETAVLWSPAYELLDRALSRLRR